NLRHVRRNSAIDLAFEIFDDFGPASSPLLGSSNLRAVLEHERIGKRRHHLVSVLELKALTDLIVAALSRPKSRDLQLIHHILMVVIPSDGLRSAAAGALTCLTDGDRRHSGCSKGETNHSEP